MIKNIIFDLGGVILNLDHLKTIQAFKELGANDIDTFYSQRHQETMFDEFEIGKISADIFRDKFNHRLNLNLPKAAFDQAWNAMLLDLPKERLEFIKQLRQHYKIFLFSNINEIHLET